MDSLEKLCITLIINEFERFYSAFNETNDVTLKRIFEFLQREYSFELASKLHSEKRLEDEYLGFLLNEHLTVFDGGWLKRDHDLTLSEYIFSRLPNLIKISPPFKCNDEDVKNIAKFCPEVAEINMSWSDITNDGIKFLCRDENERSPCPKLKKIFIKGSNVTDEGVKYLLQNLPSLELIEYENLPIVLHSLHKEDFIKHNKMNSYNLTHLDFFEVIDFPYFSDLLTVCFAVCPKLKSVKCGISNDQQLNLLSNSNLEALDLIFFVENQNINISNFLKNKGSNLTCLKVSGCTISVTDLATYCPKLNTLNLGKNNFIDNDDLEPVFHCLVELVISEWNSSLEIKALRTLLLSSPKLEKISFNCFCLSSDVKAIMLNFFENHPIKEVQCNSFIVVDVNFIKNILLSCPSLTSLGFKSSFPLKIEEIVEFAETLPNKPIICIDRSLENDLKDFIDCISEQGNLDEMDSESDEDLFEYYY